MLFGFHFKFLNPIIGVMGRLHMPLGELISGKHVNKTNIQGLLLYFSGRPAVDLSQCLIVLLSSIHALLVIMSFFWKQERTLVTQTLNSSNQDVSSE